MASAAHLPDCRFNFLAKQREYPLLIVYSTNIMTSPIPPKASPAGTTPQPTPAVKPKRKRKWVLPTVLITVGLLVGLVSASTIAVSQFKKNFRLPRGISEVSAIQVTPMPFTAEISSAGFAKGLISGRLNVLQAGRIAVVNKTPGQAVAKDEIIAALDTSAEEAQLAAQKAQFANLERTLNQARTLRARGAGTDSAVDNAQAAYNQAKKQIEALEIQLRNKQLRAPFDGVVGSLSVSLGEVVQAGNILATVVPTTPVETFIELSVIPAVSKRVSVGNQATAFNSDGVAIASGKVAAIDPTLSPINGTTKITVRFPAGSAIADGEFVKVKILEDTRQNQLLVPTMAVQYNLYGETLPVLVPLTEEDAKKNPLVARMGTANLYKVKFTFIKAKERRDTFALVTEGIKPGDIVATNGQFNDGAIVRLKEGRGLAVPEVFKLPPVEKQPSEATPTEQKPANGADNKSSPAESKN